MNDKNTGILSKITIEARTEVIKELFSDVAGLIDKSDAKMAKLVEILKQQKEAVGHGNWIPYLKENFGGDAAVKRVQYYMRKVDESNSRIFNYLEDGESQQSTTPRSERKPANVVVTTPLDEPDDSDAEIESPSDSQTRVLDDLGEPDADQIDDDPAPDPPTQRTTAKGSEKVSEDKKPPTQTITPEILPDESVERLVDTVDDWFRAATIDMVVTRLIERTENQFEQKKTAKALRKWADKLDPPTKFVKPSLEDVTEYCQQRKNGIDPEAFLAHYGANGWKLSNGNKMADWRDAVITWEKRDKANGKGKSNGSGTGTTQDPASCLGPNGRPRVERAKIVYK